MVPTIITLNPTGNTIDPSQSPTLFSDYPTATPSENPTATFNPTTTPSKIPSKTPSKTPSESPSITPSRNPTTFPTTFPTVSPTISPSIFQAQNVRSNEETSFMTIIIIIGVLLFCVVVGGVAFFAFRFGKRTQKKLDNSIELNKQSPSSTNGASNIIPVISVDDGETGITSMNSNDTVLPEEGGTKGNFDENVTTDNTDIIDDSDDHDELFGDYGNDAMTPETPYEP